MPRDVREYQLRSQRAQAYEVGADDKLEGAEAGDFVVKQGPHDAVVVKRAAFLEQWELVLGVGPDDVASITRRLEALELNANAGPLRGVAAIDAEARPVPWNPGGDDKPSDPADKAP